MPRSSDRLHLRPRRLKNASHGQRTLFKAFAYRPVKYRAPHGIYCFARPPWHRFAASFATLRRRSLDENSLSTFLLFPPCPLFLFFISFFSSFFHLTHPLAFFFTPFQSSTRVDTLSLSTTDDYIGIEGSAQRVSRRFRPLLYSFYPACC